MSGAEVRDRFATPAAARAPPPDEAARLRFLASPEAWRFEDRAAAREPAAPPLRHPARAPDGPTLRDATNALHRPHAPIECLETHMSWLFLGRAHVLKLKKPVRYPYLDFSTVAAREFNCREELRLNRRLAPQVYLGLRALRWDGRALALDDDRAAAADRSTLDWLVCMRRLPAAQMLDARLAAGAALAPGSAGSAGAAGDAGAVDRPDATGAPRTVSAREVDALAAVLIDFYRHAEPVALDGVTLLARLRHEHAINREVLGRPGFGLAEAGPTLDRFELALGRAGPMLAARARHGGLVDGHGDLRPEHVCLIDPPVVIDALEFNRALREIDPFDEVVFLGLECTMAGAPWIGTRLLERLCAASPGAAPPPPAALLALYRAYRALLRARLAAAHLLEPQPRHPERWLPRARAYLAAAGDALAALEGSLSGATPRGRP